MKLKSKLIATIVSICAAIAVMGVGVWAATSSFTVTVTNTVSLSFVNLEGSVSVKASTGAEVLADGGLEPTLASTVLYDNGDTKYNAISANATAAGGNLQFAGADFLKTANIDENTDYAAVMYEFTYTANDAAESATSVTVTETAAPAVSGNVLTITYYAKAEGQTKWTALTSGTAVTVEKGKDVTIRAVAQYSNPNHKSISTTAGDWSFTVALAAASTGETFAEGSITLLDTITDGKVTG